MENNKNYVNKEEFVSTVQAVDCMQYIIRELQEDYFEKTDKTQEDREFRLACDMPFFRAKVAILQRLICEVVRDFKKTGITCYSTPDKAVNI